MDNFKATGTIEIFNDTPCLVNCSGCGKEIETSEMLLVANGVYSCIITNVLSEKGKNTIKPNYKNSYCTMFSSAGNSINSDDLESMGL